MNATKLREKFDLYANQFDAATAAERKAMLAAVSEQSDAATFGELPHLAQVKLLKAIISI